jgi:hypothetical protein
VTRRVRRQWQQIDANTPPHTEVRTPYSTEHAVFFGLVNGRAQARYETDRPGVFDLIDPTHVLEEIQ